MLLAGHPFYGHTSTFGGLVLAARAARRLNQQDLADILAVGQATISKWERGEAHPWPKQFETVAAALGIPAETVRTAVPYRRPGAAASR
jgi:transcriptional regulator with XRE-family HTH domain